MASRSLSLSFVRTLCVTKNGNCLSLLLRHMGIFRNTSNSISYLAMEDTAIISVCLITRIMIMIMFVNITHRVLRRISLVKRTGFTE